MVLTSLQLKKQPTNDVNYEDKKSFLIVGFKKFYFDSMYFTNHDRRVNKSYSTVIKEKRHLTFIGRLESVGNFSRALHNRWSKKSRYNYLGSVQVKVLQVIS